MSIVDVEDSPVRSFFISNVIRMGCVLTTSSSPSHSKMIIDFFICTFCHTSLIMQLKALEFPRGLIILEEEEDEEKFFLLYDWQNKD